MEIPPFISAEHYIEWIQGNLDPFMQVPNRTFAYKLLVKLADELNVYSPGHDSPLARTVEDSVWLRELASEMTYILENNRREVTDLRVYVKTTWPYSHALRALAVRVAEQRKTPSPVNSFPFFSHHVCICCMFSIHVLCRLPGR